MSKNVTVVRHLRPVFYDDDGMPHKHNLGGATFLFDLDYNTRNVQVSFSVCSRKDNFNSSTGTKIARKTGPVLEINLDAFMKLANVKGGFVDALWSTIEVMSLVSEDVNPRIKVLAENVDYYNWRY